MEGVNQLNDDGADENDHQRSSRLRLVTFRIVPMGNSKTEAKVK